MKTHLKIFLCCAAFALAQAARGDEAAAKSDALKIKQGPNGETILTFDEATQKRIGLAVANPTATDWQPEIKATGRVLDLSPLMDLLGEFRKAQITLDSSHQELERARKLKQDDNISERAVQDAEAAYILNLAAVGTVANKIQSGWGKKISEMLGPPVVPPGTERTPDKFLQALPDSVVLVRADLPAGERLDNWAQSARILSLAQKTAPVWAYLFDELPVIDPQTQQQGILLAADQTRTNQLMQGEAVTVFIKLQTEQPISGVTIPASAILRHDGKGWIFVQTGATDFSRREISLDRAVDGGFFSADLSPTNRIVVTGAQTALSAELSGGGFNSGQRD